MEISLASLDCIDGLSELFNLYRVFYGQPSELEASKRFLNDRFLNGDSVIFIASENGNIVGFTQIYPSYSSVAMKPIWILNDMFVKDSHRNMGIATLLINAVKEHAKQASAVRIILATQISNIPAQRLYKSTGFIQDQEYYHYALTMQ